MEPLYLFVYGTLMSTFNNPMAIYLRKNALLIGKGYFNGFLFDFGNYPGAVYKSDSTEKVIGEMYQLSNDDVIFKILDIYEGINDPDFNLYERNVIPVNVDNKVYNNYVYVLKKTPEVLLINGGDYNLYINDK